MIGTIIGGAAVFVVSELAGEVYHIWHKNDEKNIAMKAGRKLADYTEVIDDKIAERKQKSTAKKNLKKANNPKVISTQGKSVDELLSALDKQIQSINKSKAADILTAEINVVNSFAKVCEMIIADAKLAKKELSEIAKLQKEAEKLALELLDGTITNQQSVKKMIKDLGNKVVPYINKNSYIIEAEKAASKAKSENKTPVKFTVVDENKTNIPDFTKQTKPLNKEEN